MARWETVYGKRCRIHLPVAHTENYNGPRGSAFKAVKSVKATGKYSVEIKTKHPDPLIYDITSYGILPKHILGEVPVEKLDKDKFNTKKPVGTGPFKFKKWKEGQYVKVTANKNYFGKGPHIHSVTSKVVPDSNALMAQFKAGEINFLSASTEDLPNAKRLVSNKKANMKSITNSGYDYILYNLKRRGLKEKKRLFIIGGVVGV